MGRDPNHFELAVFSLLWSEHCGYKHSALLLKNLPSRGRARAPGAGRERGRDRHRRGRGDRLQGESRTTTRPRSSPSRARRRASAGSCATSPRWARARSPSWTGCTSASRLPLRARRRRDRPLRQLRRRPDGRRRHDVFDEAYRGQRPRQRDVRRHPPRRAGHARQGDRAGNLVVLYGATTGRDGIGGASVLASPGSRGLRREAALRPGRRPVQRQEADRGLARARRVGPRRVAPGLRRRGPRLVPLGDGRGLRARRPPRPRPAARGGDGAVGDHDLRVAGADGRRRPAGDARRGARGLRRAGSSPRP